MRILNDTKTLLTAKTNQMELDNNTTRKDLKIYSEQLETVIQNLNFDNTTALQPVKSHFFKT